MIIANAATTGERITKPETMFDGDAVGDVRKGCGALIGGDNKIGVIIVANQHLFGMNHRAVDDIVGN